MQSSVDPPAGAPVDRAKVLRGGLLGLGAGILLLAVAMFFVVDGLDDGYSEPQEALGVFVPLTVALLALGLGVAALLPLRLGDNVDRTPAALARAWWVLAGLGVVVAALGAVRAGWWALAAVFPLVSVGLLLKDARRLERARRARSTADGTP